MIHGALRQAASSPAATLGYNWQLGPMIYGVEGDLGYLGLAGSGGYYVPFGYDASTTTDTDFYLTLRGRLGVLVNGWMIYFTGGYLGADTTVSVLEVMRYLLHDTRGQRLEFLHSATGGRSAAASRQLEGAWTAKLEYLYYDIGAVRDDASRQRHRRQHLEHRDRRQPRARRHQLPVQQLQVGQ